MWIGTVELNHDPEIQSLVSCHWTSAEFCLAQGNGIEPLSRRLQLRANPSQLPLRETESFALSGLSPPSIKVRSGRRSRLRALVFGTLTRIRTRKLTAFEAPHPSTGLRAWLFP